MQACFQKLIGFDGYFEEGGRIMEGDIEWNEVPDGPEVRAWLQVVVRTKEETKLPPVEIGITINEIMQAFEKVK